MNEAILRGERSGDSLVLTLVVDHLDASNSGLFRTQSAPLVQASRKVLLDLTGVTFIDSSGLGALLSVMRALGERKGDFRVCAVARPIKVLFELVRLHKILDIHETREEALAVQASR